MGKFRYPFPSEGIFFCAKNNLKFLKNDLFSIADAN
jgi:hypothetical protein